MDKYLKPPVAHVFQLSELRSVAPQIAERLGVASSGKKSRVIDIKKGKYQTNMGVIFTINNRN